MFEIDNYNKEAYGETGEFDPVVLDILNSEALERLKGIQQHGPDGWVWKNLKMSRYDHSLGVYFLLRKLGAPLEEQIAGLLHDVAHCAFSHVVDFVFGVNLSADFHETGAEAFVQKTDLPKVLEKHGYDFRKIMHHENFSLLERSAPDLCADRIDYFLRDAHYFGLLKMDQVKFLLGSLRVFENEIVIEGRDAALLFATKYLETNRLIYSSPEAIFFHTMLAEAIKIALKKKIISKEDLYSTDDTVKSILLKSGDSEILEKINLISERTNLLPAAKEDCDYHLKVKVRVVDPKIFDGKNTTRFSVIDSKYKDQLEKSIRLQKQGHYIKVGFP